VIGFRRKTDADFVLRPADGEQGPGRGRLTAFEWRNSSSSIRGNDAKAPRAPGFSMGNRPVCARLFEQGHSVAQAAVGGAGNHGVAPASTPVFFPRDARKATQFARDSARNGSAGARPDRIGPARPARWSHDEADFLGGSRGFSQSIRASLSACAIRRDHDLVPPRGGGRTISRNSQLVNAAMEAASFPARRSDPRR